MGDVTDWSTLKKRCDDHGCNLLLRAEPVDGGQRNALLLYAQKFVGTTKPDQAIPGYLDDNAPQHVVTQMVSQALEEWWA